MTPTFRKYEPDCKNGITLRDRALFETGIKLGALYHQFTGTPVSLSTAASIENAIQESISLQPFVKNVFVRLDHSAIENECRKNVFSYTEITGKMLYVRIEILYDSILVKASLKFNESIGYPLMQIESVETVASYPPSCASSKRRDSDSDQFIDPSDPFK